jgi:hypothetical protein
MNVEYATRWNARASLRNYIIVHRPKLREWWRLDVHNLELSIDGREFIATPGILLKNDASWAEHVQWNHSFPILDAYK